MSKYLEALKCFKDIEERCKNDYEQCIVGYNYEKELSTIKEALNRLEAIDNAKPSEALKCLEEMCNDKTIHDYILYNCLDEDFTYIRQALIKAQKQEKVLNIIIDREVSVQSFRRKNYKDYEDYCYRSNIYENSTPLTQEEFILLKEWLKNVTNKI